VCGGRTPDEDPSCRDDTPSPRVRADVDGRLRSISTDPRASVGPALEGLGTGHHRKPATGDAQRLLYAGAGTRPSHSADVERDPQLAGLPYLLSTLRRERELELVEFEFAETALERTGSATRLRPALGGRRNVLPMGSPL